MWGEVIAATLAAFAALLSSWVAAGGPRRRRQSALKTDAEILSLLPSDSPQKAAMAEHLDRAVADHLSGGGGVGGGREPHPIWIQLPGAAVMIAAGVGIIVGFGKSEDLKSFATIGALLIGVGAMLAMRALTELTDGSDA